APTAGPGDPITDRDGVDVGPDRGDLAGALIAGYQWEVRGIDPRTYVGVVEVHAAGGDLYQHIGASGTGVIAYGQAGARGAGRWDWADRVRPGRGPRGRRVLVLR